MKNCSICHTKLHKKFNATLLNKYNVAYYQCVSCGLLQTEAPYWLNTAYKKAIAIADTGLVSRNFVLACKLAVLLYRCFDPKAAYLDIAGGYGMLTRLMRDYGFDYYWSDLYCQNELSCGFEADKATRPFAALTAFEVLEHIYDPLDFLQKQIELYDCRTLIFTTELYNGEEPPTKDWWYYAFATGQHISFYQVRTFEYIAKRLGLRFYSVGNLHVLTEHFPRKHWLLKTMLGRISPMLALLIRKKLGSLTFKDHVMLINQANNKLD